MASLAVREKKSPFSAKESDFDVVDVTFSRDQFPFDSSVTKALYVTRCMLYALCFVQEAFIAWRVTSTSFSSSWYVWLNFLVGTLTYLPDLIASGPKLSYIGRRTENPYRPRLLLRSEDGPPIDICITTCGEELSVIMDTVSAASTLDYPAYRVFVLDDAKSQELEAAVKSFNQNRDSGQAVVTYLSREKPPGQPHYYKSGNLRFGLNEMAKRCPNAEFVAALDADMIPERLWLRRLVPHLLLDKKLAMVVPPQVKSLEWRTCACSPRY